MQNKSLCYFLALVLVSCFCLVSAKGAAAQPIPPCPPGEECPPPVVYNDAINLECAVEALTNHGRPSFLRFFPRQCSIRVTFQTKTGKNKSKVLSCSTRPNFGKCTVRTTLKALGLNNGDRFVSAHVDPVITLYESMYGCVNDEFSPGYSVGVVGANTMGYTFNVLHKYICAR